MNKRDARKMAMSRSFSAGELRDLIDQAEYKGNLAMSKVNPAVPLWKALEVYRAAIPADPDAMVNPSRMGNQLIIANILRDCT